MSIRQFITYHLSARAEHIQQETRVALYLRPSAFPALAVRWYLAARAERERTQLDFINHKVFEFSQQLQDARKVLYDYLGYDVEK